MATDNKIISKSETFAFLGGSHVLFRKTFSELFQKFIIDPP